MSEDITLRDVEMAIRVLEEYLKHVHRARSVLQRYHALGSQGYRRAEDLIAEMIARDLAARARFSEAGAGGEERGEEEMGVDVEKAVERLRALAEKEKKRLGEKQQPS